MFYRATEEIDCPELKMKPTWLYPLGYKAVADVVENEVITSKGSVCESDSDDDSSVNEANNEMSVKVKHSI